MADWSPTRYLRFADERSRSFRELVARVAELLAAREVTPSGVVDLGCGPGHLTGVLRSHWPDAAVTGVDSSPAMIATARELHDPGTTYIEGDIADYAAGRLSVTGADVVVSNAALQWVPEHRSLLPDLRDSARRVFAFQVPGNHDAPSHRLLREIAAREPYASALGAPVPRRATEDPGGYLDLLAGPGWGVDAWETTYTHVLHGPDPVLSWISATGAQPTLHALQDADPALRERFERDYGAALREAYPERPYGTPLEFRRVFVVAARG
ncbi:methyltransferase domain-containing protein [Myceligenerans pegani]|uniref:Methyltransferase domain-containing protein n=1 Tax=Myceligenerans pegani TaxID=2776917 RepID=A0ABR9MYQ2_9MICO|nr:methyltransferase domain-containing protein [Myceligenerans sp. TRM 65318]MBE1876497.1 methyltransferase domain-containing protein [Myceligenerans sp. TRM 65318]MBE3018768.1 methyltransferase domain-containing protein [Myceligenerans sp. TRM 65318]